ncbi:MAG: TonB-dependent receptor [Opitutaceae bacterium]|nr:TonB-dependent receptor [Opitutaceae bacterium]
MSSIVPAFAQTSAGITGTVSNTATGQYLEGAEVTVSPGNMSVLTTRTGSYALPNLAPGRYSVTATYSGLDAKTIEVNVTAGGTTTQDIELSSGVYQLDKFVVEGEREGNALAITQRRNAGNVKDVISSDAFGNVADLNLGNFLLRMPGVSKEESEGEIIRIQIRGANSNLNAVSVDGTRGANGSTRDLNRAFEIDKIPADFIETIEITKAATPDMDADSIGGAVNLKTKSALDRKGRRFTYNIGNTLNLDQMSFRPLASISYSDVIKNKVGLLFTASYNESHKPRDRSNLDYEPTSDTDRPVFFTARNWGQDQLKHKRAGLGLRLDYKLTEATKIYFNTMYSLYKDQLNRRQPTISAAAASNIVSVTENVTETRNQTFTINQNLRNRDVETLNFTLGGESTALWGGKLDFTANYSPSKGTERRFIPDRSTAGVGFSFDRSRTHRYFVIDQISGPDIHDPRNSTMTSLDLRNHKSRDRIVGGQLNFRKPVETAVPLVIKTGVRYREQKRRQDQGRQVFSYVGPDGVPGPVGAANDDDLGRFFDPGYTHTAFLYPKGFQFLKLPEFAETLRTQPQLFRENVNTTTRDTLRQDGSAEETVSAAYVQGEVKLGALLVITGVRVEDTVFTGRGWRQEITAEERARRAAYVGTVTPEETARRATAEYFPRVGEGEYRDWFPSVHFKYNFTRGLVGRLSYSTGIGRPNFGQIIPTTSVDNDRLRVTANNPELQPQYSKNYDAALEYYFEPAGLVSVGVFEKNLRNFIFRANVGTLGPDNDVGEAYTGYELTTDRNGGSATIRGLEFSYSQQFSHLPGFWRGFGAFLNFTWLRTEGDYGTPGAARTGSQLPLFTPRTGNVGVSYIGHGWTARVKMNYSSDRLESFNADPSRRTYDKGSTPVDLNLAYALNRRLSVYADVINVFNTGTNHTYRYIRDRAVRNDLYTTVIKFGVSGSF